MTKQEKWIWIADYCKAKRLPPAQSWAWEMAEKACNEYINNKQKEKTKSDNLSNKQE